MEFLKSIQPDIMLALSAICGVLALLVCMTNTMSQKRKLALMLVKISAMLTDQEFDQIKKHPVYGNQILSTIYRLPYLSIGALCHHERYDGRGYPSGLKGEDIPDIARIIAVADAYDAMTSKRSYRDPIPQQKVREEVLKGMGSQFDPQYANVFEAKEDCVVHYAGFETAHAETDVEYSVYLLNPGAKTPVDGTLIAERSAHYTYAGYHTTDLGETARIPAGSRYSIVVRASAGGQNELSVAIDLNMTGVTLYKQETINHYAETVVNPGESFVGSGNEWTDWTEIILRLEAMNGELNGNGFVYDSFPIRSYTCAAVK